MNQDQRVFRFWILLIIAACTLRASDLQTEKKSTTAAVIVRCLKA